MSEALLQQGKVKTRFSLKRQTNFMEMNGINRSSCNNLTVADNAAFAAGQVNSNKQKCAVVVVAYRQTYHSRLVLLPMLKMMLLMLMLFLLQILPYQTVAAHPVKRSIDQTTTNVSNVIENLSNTETVLNETLAQTETVVANSETNEIKEETQPLIANTQTSATNAQPETILVDTKEENSTLNAKATDKENYNGNENDDNEILNEHKTDYAAKANFEFHEIETLEETIRNAVRNDMENEQEQQSAIIEVLKEQEHGVPSTLAKQQEIIAVNVPKLESTNHDAVEVPTVSQQSAAHDYVDHSDVFLTAQDNSTYLKKVILQNSTDTMRDAKQLEIGPLHNLNALSDGDNVITSDGGNSVQNVEEAVYKVNAEAVEATATAAEKHVVRADENIADAVDSKKETSANTIEQQETHNAAAAKEEFSNDVSKQENTSATVDAFGSNQSRSAKTDSEEQSQNGIITTNSIVAEETKIVGVAEEKTTNVVNENTNDLSVVLEETLVPTEMPKPEININELDKFENVEQKKETIVETTAMPTENQHVVIKKQGVQLEEASVIDSEVKAIEIESEAMNMNTASTETTQIENQEDEDKADEKEIPNETENEVNAVEAVEAVAEEEHEKPILTTDTKQIIEININQEDDVEVEQATNVIVEANKESEESKEMPTNEQPTDTQRNDSSEESQEIAVHEQDKKVATTTVLPENVTTETAVTFKGSRSVSVNNFSHKYDDAAATLFEAYPPHNAEQTLNDNLAAESAHGIGKILPSTDNLTGHLANATSLVVTLCSILTVLFILVSLFVFMVSFQRQHGTLDIEMQEQRCGKENIDDEDEDAQTQTKLLEVELPPSSLLALNTDESDECL